MIIIREIREIYCPRKKPAIRYIIKLLNTIIIYVTRKTLWRMQFLINHLGLTRSYTTIVKCMNSQFYTYDVL